MSLHSSTSHRVIFVSIQVQTHARPSEITNNSEHEKNRFHYSRDLSMLNVIKKDRLFIDMKDVVFAARNGVVFILSLRT